MSNYKQLHSNEEAKEEARKLLERAFADEGFMVAAWSFSDGEIKYLGKTTRKYPPIDYIIAVKDLATDCCNELQESNQPPEPLPMADIAKLLPKQS